MIPIPKPIKKLLNSEHVLSLATSDGSGVHCCNCFYYFWEEQKMLVFKSEAETRHIHQALQNNSVAGTIFYSGKKVFKVIGIQFYGELTEIKDKELKMASYLYYKRFPIGKIISSPFWGIRLGKIKYTETIAGIKRKIQWHLPVM